MSTYQEKLLEAKRLLGSYKKLGLVCGVSGNAVMKWCDNNQPPRTEYTGETNYAELISKAVNGRVSKDDLIPKISYSSNDVSSHDRRIRDRRTNPESKSLD